VFPDNELERALQDANAPGGDVLAWVGRVLGAQVWVPVTRTEDGGGHFHVLEHEGDSLVPVFTSDEQLEWAQPATDRVVVATRDLLEQLPAGVGLAVNPGGALGLPLSREALTQALTPGAGGRTAPAGTAMHLGRPAEEPSTLLTAIGEAVRAQAPGVREMSRVWAVVGDQPPGLVVVAALDQDTPAERERTLRAVASVAGAAAFSVDVSFAGDGGQLLAWTRQHATPFFVRERAG